MLDQRLLDRYEDETLWDKGAKTERAIVLDEIQAARVSLEGDWEEQRVALAALSSLEALVLQRGCPICNERHTRSRCRVS